MNTELVIDWTRCEARGVCIDLLPGVLRPDDWGYPIGRYAGGTIPVTIGAREAAATAVRECPRLALRLATRP
ncbi:MAG: ferredoxin [Actinomycetota bacterium]|nr:ferredoxin [Actinomycetota bacterium]